MLRHQFTRAIEAFKFNYLRCFSGRFTTPVTTVCVRVCVWVCLCIWNVSAHIEFRGESYCAICAREISRNILPCFISNICCTKIIWFYFCRAYFSHMVTFKYQGLIFPSCFWELLTTKAKFIKLVRNKNEIWPSERAIGKCELRCILSNTKIFQITTTERHETRGPKLYRNDI